MTLHYLLGATVLWVLLLEEQAFNRWTVDNTVQITAAFQYVNMVTGGEMDGSAIKNIGCSSRRFRFKSQHSHGGSKQPVKYSSGWPDAHFCPLWTLCAWTGMQATHKIIKYFLKKLKHTQLLKCLIFSKVYCVGECQFLSSALIGCFSGVASTDGMKTKSKLYSKGFILP